MGYSLNKRPQGLKRHRRTETAKERDLKAESYFDLALRVG